MNQRREIKDGILYFDGCSTVDLAKQYGTPLYVMSEGDIEDKMREIKNLFFRQISEYTSCLRLEGVLHYGNI